MIRLYPMMQLFTNLDTKLFFLLNNIAGQSKIGDFLVVFFAEYLAFVLPVAFLVLLYKKSLFLREKLLMIGVVFGSSFVGYVLTKIIRFFYIHPRPPLLYDVQSLLVESSNSFPSMHATVFFAFSFAIYFFDKKWGTWFLLASLLMGISRVMAGVHYPTDILGGAIIGFVIAYIVHKFGGLTAKSESPYL